MNPKVTCGTTAQWPVEEVRCIKTAGHADSHIGYTDGMRSVVWKDRAPVFGDDLNQPVTVVLTGDSVTTESWAGHQFSVSLVNDEHTVVVDMNRDYIRVRVNGSTTLDLKA